MKCGCGRELHCDTVLTHYGSTIDYSECPDCGIVDLEK